MPKKDRLVIVAKLSVAKERFRGLGVTSVYDPLLEAWHSRLEGALKKKPKSGQADSLDARGLPVDLVVEELVKAYKSSKPKITINYEVGNIFPLAITAVFADSDDAEAVENAARKRLL